MARVYSQSLLDGVVFPGLDIVQTFAPPDTYVIRDIILDIVNGFPDTGGGFVTVSLGGLIICRRTFPGAFAQVEHWEGRVTFSGTYVLTASCDGGGSLGVGVHVSGYNLTP